MLFNDEAKAEILRLEQYNMRPTKIALLKYQKLKKNYGKIDHFLMD